MTYSKPEVAVLGEAAVLIEGSRIGSAEQPDLKPKFVSDCEFDD